MSLALYEIESLRFYTEEEILLRNQFTERLFNKLKQTLLDMNQAWKFHRVEGPLLTPRNHVSDSYDENDIFITQIKKANQELVLRPETTKSSYLYANSLYPTQMQKKLPVCIWQLGKSFRVEKSDGATAAALRFNEFYQLEFQCIYSNTTLADYRKTLIEALIKELSMVLGGNKIRTIESDRLPSYSESTLDIETIFNGKWKEIASCSIRNDFSDTTKVCEIAFGIDRIIEIYNQIKHLL
jgi:glycyl-tRNA synthetase